MKITLLRRLRRDGSRAANYSYKFDWRGQQILRATKFSAELCGTVEQARADARSVAKTHLRALELGCADQVDAFQSRRAKACPTLDDLHLAVFGNPVGRLSPRANIPAGYIGRMSENSARAAWLQLLNMLRKAQPGLRLTGSLTHSLALISAQIVTDFAAAVTSAAEAEHAGELRLRQLMRSANSTWSTARMLFSKSMRRYYAELAGAASVLASCLVLPPSIDAFCQYAPFASKRCGSKKAYNTPPDHIIAATFRDLEEVQRTANPNLYLAVHLALAFGLRKGEIIGARVRNVTSSNGVAGFELCENWVARQMRDAPKNGDAQPFIVGKNGSLARLEPLLRGRDPSDYILTGPHVSCRMDYVWRDISAWMRRLGWGTQKTVHEFRSYAIAQVARSEDLFAASKWARHSNVVITQKHYGHHCKSSTLDVPIEIPTIADPGYFTPTLASA